MAETRTPNDPRRSLFRVATAPHFALICNVCGERFVDGRVRMAAVHHAKRHKRAGQAHDVPGAARAPIEDRYEF